MDAVFQPFCVGNFEALLLAKACGLDAQRLREVLLACPATNGTVAAWDTTYLTWQEHDMDVVMDLAQTGRPSARNNWNNWGQSHINPHRRKFTLRLM